MKFQVELEIFKINLKIVFCVQHFKCIRMISLLHQFYANSVNTIIYMQAIHETLLVISVIDNFCAQLKLFCETHLVRIFSSCLREHKFQLENFRTGTENTTSFHEICNVLENMRVYPHV